jgi:ribosomal protein S18 acetylase RimI-like enzyme
MTQTGTKVRAARLDDLDTLVGFNAAMARETEGKLLDSAALAAGVRTVLREPHRGFYLVAELAETVVGCLMVTFEWSDWRNGDWWWLQSVYVAPAYRKRGVFRALYAEVERRLHAAPEAIGIRLYVERDNRPAQQTYATLGLRETSYRVWSKPFRRGVVE